MTSSVTLSFWTLSELFLICVSMLTSCCCTEVGCPPGRLYRECERGEGCPFSCAHVSGREGCYSDGCEEGCHCPPQTYQHHGVCLQASPSHLSNFCILIERWYFAAQTLKLVAQFHNLPHFQTVLKWAKMLLNLIKAKDTHCKFPNRLNTDFWWWKKKYHLCLYAEIK